MLDKWTTAAENHLDLFITNLLFPDSSFAEVDFINGHRVPLIRVRVYPSLLDELLQVTLPQLLVQPIDHLHSVLKTSEEPKGLLGRTISGPLLTTSKALSCCYKVYTEKITQPLLAFTIFSYLNTIILCPTLLKWNNCVKATRYY